MVLNSGDIMRNITNYNNGGSEDRQLTAVSREVIILQGEDKEKQVEEAGGREKVPNVVRVKDAEAARRVEVPGAETFEL